MQPGEKRDYIFSESICSWISVLKFGIKWTGEELYHLIRNYSTIHVHETAELGYIKDGWLPGGYKFLISLDILVRTDFESTTAV